MRQHAPRIAHQQREQLEFLRRESNFLVAAQHAAAVVIDREIAELQSAPGHLVLGKHTAQRDANAREQFLGTERLGDVIVGADVEHRDFVRLAAARRQHDDRHGRFRANAPADLGPLDVRQPQVEDDEIGSLRTDGRQRLFARCRDSNVVSSGPQERRERALNRRFIVDEQDSGGLAHAVCSADAVGRLSAGTTMENCAPPPAQFSAQMRPCSAINMPRAIARPMPVPATRRAAPAPR